jgi:hypothetical protein
VDGQRVRELGQPEDEGEIEEQLDEGGPLEVLPLP